MSAITGEDHHRVGALFVQTDAWAERDFLQDLSDYWSPYETWRVDEKIDALLEWPTGRQDIHLFSHEGDLFYDRSDSLRVRIEEFFSASRPAAIAALSPATMPS